jgi:hypothetical protein
VPQDDSPFRLRPSGELAEAAEPRLHVYGPGAICDTEARGHTAPRELSPAELVLDATQGFVPLWADHTTLRWRFQPRSLALFETPLAATEALARLLGEAILQWGPAAPVRFTRDDDAWDFEIAVREIDRCSPAGCVLASAFFPDAGRHELVVYPQLFTQSSDEQIETLVHELGHIFGLRHFFALVRETAWPAEVFGTHERFTIMNYGSDSRLTDEDGADLARLYEEAWSGRLTAVNGTPVRLVRPFNASGASPADLVAVSSLRLR